MEDNFNYPIKSYISPWGKQQYTYKCSVCEKEVNGYYHQRVKGKIVCCECRRNKSKQEYRERQAEIWRVGICEN